MQDNISSTSRQHSTEPFPPQTIWVLGAGYFGALGAQRLSRRYPDASFLVIDTEEEKLREIHETYTLPFHVEDALVFLEKNPPADEVWIIPAIPVHAAFLLIRNRLNHLTTETRVLPVPDEADLQVPNPYRIPPGSTLYASFATFRCPDACNEPDEICTYTKEPRPGNLFERLAQVRIPSFHTVVIRSHQLAPGVGGYTGAQLGAALEEILKQPGNYLIATACRCHGVIDALSWQDG